VTADHRPLHVVVCGAVFGQVYLEAFRREESRLVLAGILARGSGRARACAGHYGVPLYTAVDQIPPTVGAACVVIRSRALGGQGTEIAHALMRRGTHVLQEHPLHPDELAESLRVARANGVQYRVNPFYSNLGAVRRFIGAARELCAAGAPLFVDAACGAQLSYSLLDILRHALGRVRPWDLRMGPGAAGDPFVTVQATLGGTPVSLRVQHELDPADPDGFSHLLHRIAVGFDEGTLLLVDTHGPVVWIPRPQFPRDVRSDTGVAHFARSPEATPRLVTIGPTDAPSYDNVFREHWPRGVVRALLDLRHSVERGQDAVTTGQHGLAVAELWRDLLAVTGPPRLVRGSAATAQWDARLDAMCRAGLALEAMP
jgi:thiazolinyl imide reductase